MDLVQTSLGSSTHFSSCSSEGTIEVALEEQDRTGTRLQFSLGTSWVT